MKEFRLLGHWDLYLRLLRGIQSVNQQNRVHILLENRMSTIERSELILRFHQAIAWRAPFGFLERPRVLPLFRKPFRELPRKLSANLSEWISHLSVHDRLSDIPSVEPMIRERSNRKAHFYRAFSGRNTGLLIGWSGSRGRLMMPIANYLPVASSLQHDLLLLQPDRASGYGSGIPRFGADFNGLVDGLSRFRDSSGYEKVIVLGTSLGSGPALVSAPRLGADKCVVVGLTDIERSPYLPKWDEVFRLWSRSEGPSLSITAGSAAPADIQFSKMAQEHLGGTLELIQDQGHTPIWGLLRSGKFFDWFKRAAS